MVFNKERDAVKELLKLLRRDDDGDDDTGTGNDDTGTGNDDTGTGNGDTDTGNDATGTGNDDDTGTGNDDTDTGNDATGTGNDDTDTGNDATGTGNGDDTGTGNGEDDTGTGTGAEISDEAREWVELAIADLVEADRQLALTLIEDAEATPVQDPDNQDEIDELLEEARDELIKGDEDRDAGKSDEAIAHYLKAWEKACKAIELANEGVNEPPLAVDDQEDTDNNTVLVIGAPGVLGNDSDPDLDPLTVSAFDAASALGGAVAVAPDGSFVYDPTVSATLQALSAGDSLDDTFTYTAADGQGGFDTAIVTVTVHGPGVVTVSARTLKLESIENLEEHVDESRRFEKAIEEIEDSLDEDFWIDDDHLDKKRGHRVFSEERHAVKELIALLDRGDQGGDDNDDTGTGTGSGGDSEISEEALEWAQMAIDNLVAADRQLALTLIEEAEDAPVSDPSKQDKVDEELEKAREELAKGDEARDAGDADNAIQHYRKAWGHACHALRFADAGSVSAAGNAFSVNAGATLSVGGPGLLENDADANDGALTASLIDGPEHGDLQLAPDGSFTYTPDSEFEGTDQFSYAAANDNEESDDAVVVITVTADEGEEAPNEPPVAGDDAFETNEDAVLGAEAPGVLANDEDTDGDDLTVVSFDPVSALGATVTVAADGSFTYDPTAAEELQALAEADSVDDTFSYAIDDGNAGVATGTVTVTVSGVADSTALTANDDEHAATANAVLVVDAPGVLVNDEDADGDALEVNDFDAVSALGATVTVAADGSFTYDPTAAEQLQALAEGDSAEDSFAYTIADGNEGAATAVVTVTVTGVARANTVPVAFDDQYEVANDVVLAVDAPGVLVNDEDADGDALEVNDFDAVSALGATVTVAADGSFTYDPTAAEQLQALAEGDSAEDSFAYTIADGNGGAATATVTVTVAPPGGPPETVLAQDLLPGVIDIDDIVGLDLDDIVGLGLRNRVGGGGVPDVEEFDIAELLPGSWGSPTERLTPLAGGALRAVSAQREQDFWLRRLEDEIGGFPLEPLPPVRFGPVDLLALENGALPTRRLSLETAILDPHRARADDDLLEV